jgi:hypothetical protein
LPAPAKPPAASVPPPAQPASGTPATPSASGLELKVRQQAQYIEALISQNDALTAKLAATKASPQPVASVVRSRREPAPLPRPPATPLPVSAEPTLTPNADNVIDLVALS